MAKLNNTTVLRGDKFMIPETLELTDAIKILSDLSKYEDTETEVIERFGGYLVFDAAWAVSEVLREKYGIVLQKSTPGFFGDRPPTLLQIPISRTESKEVPIGRLNISAIGKGYLDIYPYKAGNQAEPELIIQANIKRKYLPIVQDLFASVKEYLRQNSLFRGKAMEIAFTDNRGYTKQFPDIHFMDVSDIAPESVIFTHSIQKQIEGNVMTPIVHRERCKHAGIPFKRGILLAGPYGTGKSLVSKLAARTAEDNGVTFIYIKNANDFFHAFELTRNYGPAVIFCEDIDVLMSGERTQHMNKFLNILDGIDTKNLETFSIFTTNHQELINPAFVRPGRLDTVITITPPDKEAVIKLIELYAKGLLKEGEDLEPVAEVLAGTIPAIVRECIEKAKLYSISESDETIITADALLVAAEQMTAQIEVLKNAFNKRQDVRLPLKNLQIVLDGDQLPEKEKSLKDQVMEILEDEVSDSM